MCLFELMLLKQIQVLKTVKISQKLSPLRLIWNSFNFLETHKKTIMHHNQGQSFLCFQNELFQHGVLFFLNVSEDVHASCPTMTKAFAPSAAGLRLKPSFSVYNLAATQHPQIWAPFLLFYQGGCLALQQNTE